MPKTPDLADLFTAGQSRLVDLVRALDPADLTRLVPATPAWTVRDLVGHLAGVSADVLDGNVHPESEEWTAAHVRDRSDLSVEQVLDEWLGTGPRVAASLSDVPLGQAAALVVDLTVHEQDLRGAVGEPPVQAREALEASAGFLARGLGGRLASRGLPALRLEADGWSAVAGRGEPGATVRASVLELVRALAGRRSAAQVAAYEWSGDASVYLPAFPVLGELRAHDLVE